MRFTQVLLLVVFCMGISVSNAAFGRLPDESLDQKALRTAYMESEFVNVARVLEEFRKSNPPKSSKMDWVFTYKYLGVIYAADSNQTARAEQNFNQLLKLSPNIELIDMYCPPKIQAIFNEVKKEYRHRIEYESRYDALGNPINAAHTPEARQPALSGKAGRNWVWLATVGAVFGVGIGYWVWFEFIREPKVNVTTIN